MQIQTFERDADRLLSLLERARYEHLSGRSAALPLVEIFGRFADEPWAAVYAQLHDLPLDPRALSPLLDLAATFHVEDWAARATSRLFDAEATARVAWRDEVIPLRSVPARLANEPDRDRRHEIEEAARAVEEERVLPLRRDVLLGRRAGFEELQQGDELTVRAALRGLDLDALSRLATYVLDETAELYLDALRDQLVHHGLDGADAWESDLGYVLRGAEYDPVYPAHRLMPALIRTLRQFGVTFEDQQAVRLDGERRPTKWAEPFCAPISPPDEVIAVVAPLGPRADAASVFEQIGVAERHGHVDRTQPLAPRRLGDPAVLHAYGLLFRRLTGDPAWLAERLEAHAARDAARLEAFEHLYRLRRAAAEWLHVRDLLAAADPDDAAEPFVERMHAALGVRAFPVRMLDAARDPLRGPDFLRGALLAHQLGQFLAAEYDETWFASERAGRFVVDRWREGQRYTAEEMARFLGFDGLDARPLFASLRAALVG